ncbi:MAG: hypothetical protein U0Y68_26515 [Blastocatellia bacterium]
MRNVLVIAQLALSLVLLIGAGLIVRSLQQAQTLHPGFNPHRAALLSFDLGLQGYDKARGEAASNRCWSGCVRCPASKPPRSPITCR